MPVTQADRQLYIRLKQIGPISHRAILAGEWDHADEMQMIAAHRLAALDEAAGVVEAMRKSLSFTTGDAFAAQGAWNIATRINHEIAALKDKSDD